MKISTQLQRKAPGLPVFVVVPGKHAQKWKLTATTVIEGAANGHAFGRRTIKAWGKGSDDWFVEFTARFCKEAALNVGDEVMLEIQLADTSIPANLENMLVKDKSLSTLWNNLSERERREAIEHIRAAKVEATRIRRANSIVEKLLDSSSAQQKKQR